MRTALIVTVSCLLAACARPDHRSGWPDRFVLSAGPQPGYAIKRVVEKLSPATLLGDDGSICRTSADRFAATEVDTWTDCNWTLDRLDD